MRNDLKVLRVKNKMTQQQLADKLGVSVVTYNLIEQGKRQGSKDFWFKLQQLFNLADSELWQLFINN